MHTPIRVPHTCRKGVCGVDVDGVGDLVEGQGLICGAMGMTGGRLRCEACVSRRSRKTRPRRTCRCGTEGTQLATTQCLEKREEGQLW
jgi:hypothetical protein